MLSKSRKITRSAFPKSRPVKSVRGKFVSASLFSNSDRPSKFSFSISKKVAKTAVLRNKLRRAGYRTVGKTLNNVDKGFMIVFFIHTVPPETKQLENDINEQLKWLGVLK